MTSLQMNIENKTTIRSLTNEFVKITKERDIKLGDSNVFGTEIDYFGWIPTNIKVSKKPVPAGNFKEHRNFSEGKILKIAVKMSLSQAFNKLIEMLKNGDFDKTYHVTIFLTDKGIHPRKKLKIICSRFKSSTFNSIDCYIVNVNYKQTYENDEFCYVKE